MEKSRNKLSIEFIFISIYRNLKVQGVEIIPLEELGRPRIEVTIQAFGISGDNFSNYLELVDEAVHAVASFDENYLLACTQYVELNPVRAGIVKKPV